MLVACGLFLLATTGRLVGEPSAAAGSSFNTYVTGVEARLGQQHRSREDFLAVVDSASRSEERLRRGEVVKRIQEMAKMAVAA